MVLTLCTAADQEDIQKYLAEVLPGEKPNFATLIDGYSVFKQFRARGYPSNFIVDIDGLVRFFHWNLGAHNTNRFQREMEALVMEKI